LALTVNKSEIEKVLVQAFHILEKTEPYKKCEIDFIKAVLSSIKNVEQLSSLCMAAFSVYRDQLKGILAEQYFLAPEQAVSSFANTLTAPDIVTVLTSPAFVAKIENSKLEKVLETIISQVAKFKESDFKEVEKSNSAVKLFIRLNDRSSFGDPPKFSTGILNLMLHLGCIRATLQTTVQFEQINKAS